MASTASTAETSEEEVPDPLKRSTGIEVVEDVEPVEEVELVEELEVVEEVDVVEVDEVEVVVDVAVGAGPIATLLGVNVEPGVAHPVKLIVARARALKTARRNMFAAVGGKCTQPP